MSKHGMISYKHDDEKKCEIFIQAKMTKKPFSKLDRNSIMLELVHSDVCELERNTRNSVVILQNCYL